MGAPKRILSFILNALNVSRDLASLTKRAEKQRDEIEELKQRVTRLEASLDMLMRLAAPRRLE